MVCWMNTWTNGWTVSFYWKILNSLSLRLNATCFPLPRFLQLNSAVGLGTHQSHILQRSLGHGDRGKPSALGNLQWAGERVSWRQLAFGYKSSGKHWGCRSRRSWGDAIRDVQPGSGWEISSAWWLAPDDRVQAGRRVVYLGTGSRVARKSTTKYCRSVFFPQNTYLFWSARLIEKWVKGKT